MRLTVGDEFTPEAVLAAGYDKLRAAGFSNAKAKRDLGWRPRHPSWRQGFTAEVAA